jgi:tetratricopeptide (TPR) repeat protein
MEDEAGRHAELAGMLIKSWKDLSQRGTGSQIVLVAVPPGWGGTAVLDQLAQAVGADDARDTPLARIEGRKLYGERGLQAAALKERLAAAVTGHPAAEKTGLNRAAGITQVGLGLVAPFVPGLAAAYGFLLAGLAVGTAGKVWDDSPAGQDGELARTARGVAATSARLPMVVIIDDADDIDEDLALVLIENLAARHDGNVLVVAAVAPGSGLKRALTDRAWQGRIEGRVRVAAADPDMGYQARASLAREVCPQLTHAAARRIAGATIGFKDVFAVTAAPSLTELAGSEDEAQVLAAVDDAVRAGLRGPDPSPEAVIIACAGGLVHVRQAQRALDVRGLQRDPGGPEVLLSENLERVINPASPLLTAQVAVLANRDRQAMAAVMLDEALAIADDPDSGPVEQIVAAQAAHRVREDLSPDRRAALPRAQRQLAAGLEALSEPCEALKVADAALKAWPDDGDQDDRDWLQAALLRLSRLTPPPERPPLAAQLIAEAVAGGAALGLEARIWAAITLLATPGQRETALELTEHAAADLDQHAADLGTTGTRWRLQLAYHAGTAGHPAITQHLLAPLLNGGDNQTETAALAVLRAGGQGAGARLQNALLEADLAALPPGADDDRLRIHYALAANYATLGDYRQALLNGWHELDLRNQLQTPGHPDTLTSRGNIAYWTGQSGNTAEALHLARKLLADQEQVLGPDHPATLRTRNNIASWTGDRGDPAEALRLHRDLLPNQERVLGSGHPDTLTARGNVAYWTGECGDPAEALRLLRDLLPNQERVLGPFHRATLRTRTNIAHWTGRSGDTAAALRLNLKLLPDQERTLGPDHPDTLTTRSNIAQGTGKCGDPAEALRLFRDLLPDQQQALGPDHPNTLTTRNVIALWTGRCGNPAEALRLFRDLLPDRERVLGPGHPHTLTTRACIAVETAKNGDPAEALRLLRELLPDQQQVLGPEHPDTLQTRNDIAHLTGLAAEGLA